MPAWFLNQSSMSPDELVGHLLTSWQGASTLVPAQYSNLCFDFCSQVCIEAAKIVFDKQRCVVDYFHEVNEVERAHGA
jgi:hypothetical protein